MTDEANAARSLLDQLLIDSHLYKHSQAYKNLLDFVVKLRNFAPFNAMLLQLQKPGLSYAASAHDWKTRFDRWPREGARPLLILWPFGPVALVYDIQDTEGKDIPPGIASFFARGSISKEQIESYPSILWRKRIEWLPVDAGDRNAGLIRVVSRGRTPSEHSHYRIQINRNHDPPIKFATLAHELGHLFLGHLGPDKALGVSDRPRMSHSQRELEAESLAYLVCARNGVSCKSEQYLSDYVSQHTTIDDIDLYHVMHAAGQIETLLGLTGHTVRETDEKFRCREMTTGALRSTIGWQDLKLDHDFYEVETLPENDRVRYTISPTARKEVLRRLLALNHDRAKAEQAAAVAIPKTKRSSKRKTPQSAAGLYTDSTEVVELD
ncbi:MAG: ImmA/IrrE family metallo-endopeptidase [Nitrospira sp.]|nr:ImmA/IrrE family metallo-endopeptidase [Nitrospira sp.]